MSCSNAPDDLRDLEDGQSKEEVLMPRRSKLDKAKCVRCRESKSSVVAGTASFCGPCFESHLPGKIYKSISAAFANATEAAISATTTDASFGRLKGLGKGPKSSKPPIKRPEPQQGNALVAVSGGPGGLAMLDILAKNSYFNVWKKNADQDSRAQLRSVWERTWICHVDFSDVAAGTTNQSQGLRRLAADYGLEFVAVKAQDAFDPELPARLAQEFGAAQTGAATPSAPLHVDLRSDALSTAPTPSSSKTPLESLSHLLASLPPTSRPAFLGNILDALLTTVAQCLPSITHILLGETSSRQAQNIIASTASGAGWTLPLHLAQWSPLPAAADIIRVKPMKQCLLNEVAYWCYLKGIATLSTRNWHAIKAADGSIISAGGDARGKSASATLEGLTERFIAGLGTSHPSTVSTISRTGEKLTFRGAKDPEQSSRGLCPLCQSPAEPSSLDWKSRTALTSFPHKQPAMSMEAVSAALPDQSVQLAPLLCYGCLTALTAPLSAAQTRQQQDEAVELPHWVQHRVKERMSSAAMRSEIAEFLIEDEYQA